ncbi:MULTISPECIES: alpha/beta hydrolase [unclassified Streptomyces]|uniref:alpha/beta hydrolase n=1 Tax=unclassified Streptomyces TaxID=2593676 RepID=UPI001F034C51|nr:MULTISPECIES: dienelactone hydrolase family protein [unclassified Streptomyces]MCH0563474.1 dienelactone hydrolase family protein [Streptomyces sp. MUM 2J]MCH0570170.1 dienelactone hydrolase family protein [Streptomyces sp. MUM 136J]
MRRSVPAALALVCAGALTLGACGDDDGSAGASASGTEAGAQDQALPAVSEPAAAPASAAPSTEDFGCLKGKQKDRSILFKDTDGNDVHAYETGSGTTGVILSHQVDNDVCAWIPRADELAEDGYRVIAVNSNGSEVGEIRGAAEVLRGQGVRKLLLMGTSKGGTASLVAVPQVKPSVAAVVSISGRSRFNAMDAAAIVPDLSLPMYFIAAEDDGLPADEARELSALARNSAGAKLDIVPGAAHGNELLREHPSVWADIKAFLAEYR